MKYAVAAYGFAIRRRHARLIRTLAPTAAKADKMVDDRLAAPVTADANDFIYQWEASHDYDPSTGLEKIEATLLAINAADDERNPPETGVTDAALKQREERQALPDPRQRRDPRPPHHRQCEILRSNWRSCCRPRRSARCEGCATGRACRTRCGAVAAVVIMAILRAGDVTTALTLISHRINFISRVIAYFLSVHPLQSGLIGEPAIRRVLIGARDDNAARGGSHAKVRADRLAGVPVARVTGAALAFDNGQYENVPADIRAWFKGVIAPNGVPCCDIADGHRTEYDFREGAYWVPIEGQWMAGAHMPSSATAATPSVEAVVWYVHHRGGIVISCFVPADAV